jgi:hypothetical protein
MPDRMTKPASPEPERRLDDGGGPTKPDVGRPSVPNELLKRLKRVDPDQAKKYRQRSGQ